MKHYLFGLVVFYGISTPVGNLLPNPAYIYVTNKLFALYIYIY